MEYRLEKELTKVAPLTWGGIIGNYGDTLLKPLHSKGRPINLGRNHWKLKTAPAPVPAKTKEGRPINLGRNHWKLSLVILDSFAFFVAPLTWGGIIGNSGDRFVVVSHDVVAPLTWGGIIGNNTKETQGNPMETPRNGRPINLGRNHWKLCCFSSSSRNAIGRPINLGRNHWKLDVSHHTRRGNGESPH